MYVRGCVVNYKYDRQAHKEDQVSGTEEPRKAEVMNVECTLVFVWVSAKKNIKGRIENKLK